MPNFPITDAHVHLYDPDQLPYSWMQNVPLLNRRYDLGDFDKARGEVEVERIVFVEVNTDMWGGHIDEVAWVTNLAKDDKRLQGIVAAAPLERGDAVGADLETLKGFPLVKSIRRLIEREANTPGFCTRPDFVEGVRLCGRHDLAFDLCIKHWQLADAIELCRQVPDTRIVLDHIAKPAIKEGLREPWQAQLRELAAMDHVHCKVSGVVTEADHQNWQREQLRPYVEHVIDCFGFDRLFFGSDWTVSEQTHRYPEWVEILDEFTINASEDEHKKFFHDNAIAFYRL